MADGHLNKCKDCVKARVGKHREENLDDIREYDRQRGDLPHRVALRKAYAKTEQGKARVAVGRLAYIERNPEKRAAHVIVGNAVRDGRLVKGPCVHCGNPKANAHHEDYARPLEVTWLCAPCHAAHHKAERWA